MQNKKVLATATVLLSMPAVSTDLCSLGSTEVDGKWYCQPVHATHYSNVGTAGFYKQITNMLSDGNCESVSKPFSGPILPLDEEVTPPGMVSSQESRLISFCADISSFPWSPPNKAACDLHSFNLQQSQTRGLGSTPPPSWPSA